MRDAIYAAFLFACASTAALAQTPATRPENPAPQATAPFEQREDWCQKYAAWYVARSPEQATQAPDATRPTQRIENEINYCKLDPREYERQTLAELASATIPG